MTTITSPAPIQVPGAGAVTTTHRLTRALLTCGAVAGPLYVAVSLAQALTREGFDLTRHQWSLLLNGSLGWVQVLNFVCSGLLILAYSLGLRRTTTNGAGKRLAPGLIATFGVSMVIAGAFKADPALGFPVGASETAAEVSTAGMVHFTAAGVGFLAVAVACFVLARRYAREGVRQLPTFSRVTGVAFLGGFLCVASGGGSVIANLLFTATVMLVLGWMSATAVHHRFESAQLMNTSSSHRAG